MVAELLRETRKHVTGLAVAGAFGPAVIALGPVPSLWCATAWCVLLLGAVVPWLMWLGDETA